MLHSFSKNLTLESLMLWWMSDVGKKIIWITIFFTIVIISYLTYF